ncbi:MAG: hypothetical protein ACI9K4_001768, partial [Polaribacter sp.]
SKFNKLKEKKSQHLKAFCYFCKGKSLKLATSKF